MKLIKIILILLSILNIQYTFSAAVAAAEASEESKKRMEQMMDLVIDSVLGNKDLILKDSFPGPFGLIMTSPGDFDLTYNNPRSSLLEALEGKNLEMIIDIQSNDPNTINATNDLGETLLEELIYGERFESIKFIFDCDVIIKPDLDATNIFKETPIDFANRLGTPSQDPEREQYRKIAKYLTQQKIKA